MKQIAVSPSSYSLVASVIAWITALKSASEVSNGSPTATCSKESAFSAISFTRSVYSRPFIRWVGWITRVFTPFFTARSRASVTLSITTLSLFFTWSMMIWLVKPLLTEKSGCDFSMASSIAPMVKRRLSLKLVPKLTTKISFSPISSWFLVLSNAASPVS